MTRPYVLAWQDWLELSAALSGLARVRSRFIPLNGQPAPHLPAPHRSLVADDALAESTVAMARAGLYNFFATTFAEPPSAGYIAELQRSGALGALAAKGVVDDELRRWCEALGGPRCAEKLAEAYTQLLVRPGSGRVPPVATAHRPELADPEPGLQWGQAATSAVAAYQAAGLAIGGDGPFTPDHLGLELQFMQHCAARESAAWGGGDAGAARLWRAREAGFLQAALLPWAPEFCARATAARSHPYFTAMAGLLAAFLAADADYLRGTLADDA